MGQIKIEVFFPSTSSGPLQEIMAKIGKPQALGPLDENMADDDEEDEEIEDGIDIDDAAGDELAAALGAARI